MKTPKYLKPILESASKKVKSDLQLFLSVANHPEYVSRFLINYSLDDDSDYDIDEIRDLATMAEDLNRKIDFRWSPNRMESEHDKFSRYLALKKASEKTVYYTIPDRLNCFSGMSPITNSRRLAAEGLRQRNCVISREGEIVFGNIAIYSLLLDGKRWTLSIDSEEGSRGFALREIKGRFNKDPSSEQMKSIEEKLLSMVDVDKAVSIFGENYKVNFCRTDGLITGIDFAAGEATFSIEGLARQFENAISYGLDRDIDRRRGSIDRDFIGQCRQNNRAISLSIAGTERPARVDRIRFDYGVMDLNLILNRESFSDILDAAQLNIGQSSVFLNGTDYGYIVDISYEACQAGTSAILKTRGTDRGGDRLELRLLRFL